MIRSQVSANIAYAVGRVATSAGLIILMPFLVNRLSPEEYGAWALLEVVILLAGILMLLGLDIGMMRMHWVVEGEPQRARMAGTIVATVALWGLIVLLMGIGAGMWLTGLAGSASPSAWGWAIATAWAESLLSLALVLFRLRERAISFAILSTARTFLFVVLSIAFVSLGYGVSGGVAGRFIATIGFVALAMALALRARWLAVPGDWPSLRKAIRYGLPLLPANLASYVLAAGDRYFLSRLSGLAVVGVYSFAYKIGTSLDSLVTRPFAADWAPRRFRIAAEPDPDRRFAQALTLYLYPAVGFSLLVWAATPLIYEWFAPVVYLSGRGVVPIVLMAVLLFGLSYPLNLGFMLKGRTEHLSVITAVAAGICLVLYAVLIPRYGMFGAAWATLLAYGLYTSLVFIGSLRLYPIRYPLRPLLGAVLLLVAGGAMLYAAGGVLSQAAPLNMAIANLAIVLALFAILAFAYRSQARGLARLLGGRHGDGQQE